MHKMNIKPLSIAVYFWVTLCSSFTASQALGQEIGGGAVVVDPAISNAAKVAVQKLGIEMMKGNFQHGIDNMYPRWKRRLAKRAGSMAKLDAALAQSTQQQVKMQMKVVGYQASQPTAFFSVWKAKKVDPRTGKPVIDAVGREVIVSHWLAVVPTIVRVRVPDPQRGGLMREIEETGYALAVSEKGSSQWHFLTGLKPTIQDLRSLFPSLPADEKALHLPASKVREIK